MKHCFLINPAAGKGKLFRSIDGDIRAYCDRQGVDYEIYYTKGIGDAEDYIRRTCGEASGELRFYACGGDGTLNEVANRAAGYP
ncbi:MAG TPA: acylglycerol kinase family protein, partial [Bacillota bacterium]|nr:acylglycerol kinase family protein [Bacillota bacterium]